MSQSSPSTAPLPVLIVGAGPTGLLLAIWLKTLSPNRRLRIVDRADGPCEQSRAIVMHARTVEFYRQLGLLDDLLAEAHILKTVEIHHTGERRGTLPFGQLGHDLSKFPFVVTFPQDQHERLLLRHLERLGVKVEWRKQLVKLSAAADENTAVFDDDETVRAQYVVGCDGSRSVVRDQAGIHMEGKPDTTRFYVADVLLSDIYTGVDTLRICITAHGFGICVPLDGGNKVRVLGSVPPEVAPDATFEQVKPYVNASMKENLTAVEWSSIYHVSHRVASTFRRDNVFLVGDAAHVHSPVGGQGMNTGLGDATNLAWKLDQVLSGRISREILSTYDPERRAFAKDLVSTTDLAFDLITQRGIVGYLFRNILMGYIIPFLWAYTMLPLVFFRRVSQIAITYTAAPLGTAQVRAGKINAGDRLPWLRWQDSDNYEALQKRDWQVHRYPVAAEKVPAAIEGVPVYQFEGCVGAAALGLEPGVDYLVRPDGHVAVTARRGSEEIKTFVRRWGLVVAAKGAAEEERQVDREWGSVSSKI